jgi:Ca2+-binding EF-hand superfamily protein
MPPEVYLHKNSQGGIFVHERDIESLFKFIDKGNYGRISQNDLKKRLSVFAKELSSKDYKFMMAGKNDISLQELFDILRYNELDDFDPIAEAFKYFDPERTGFIDLNRLREVFHGLGYGELSYGDMQILVECADADLDGKISLEDFRRLIPIYEGDTQGKSIRIETDPRVHEEFMQNLREYGDTRRQKPLAKVGHLDPPEH